MKAKKTQNKSEMEAMNMDDKDKALIEEALKVYGIPPQWVFASRVDKVRDAAVIVTNGGKKVIHKAGEAAKFKLSMVEISGFLPKEEMFFSDRLNQGITKEELRKR
jgi:hypothetical protein